MALFSFTAGRLAALTPLVAASALAACSATATSGNEREGGPFGGTAATAPTSDATGGGADAASRTPDAGAMAPPDASTLGIVLVNASLRSPAFRLCKLDPGAAIFVSQSTQMPFPMTRMPKSSLAGVDVNGAVRIPLQSDMGQDSSAVLIPIDNDTKGNSQLESGTCRSLVCAAGGRCIPQNKLKSVTAYKDGKPFPGAFNTGGHLLVLRDIEDASDGVYFEVVPLVDTLAGGTNEIRVRYQNYSTFRGPFRFAGTASREIQNGTETTLPLSNDAFVTTTVTAGAELETSFAAIHADSEPAVPITSFYRTRAPFALLLLGGAPASAGPGAGPIKVVAIPFASPRVPSNPGTDSDGDDGGGAGVDSGPTDASRDAPPG